MEFDVGGSFFLGWVLAARLGAFEIADSRMCESGGGWPGCAATIYLRSHDFHWYPRNVEYSPLLAGLGFAKVVARPLGGRCQLLHLIVSVVAIGLMLAFIFLVIFFAVQFRGD